MEVVFGSTVKMENFEGKFGELEEAKKNHTIKKGINFNFSQTRWFSVSSLLLLIVAIDSLKKKYGGINIKITLPTEKEGEDSKVAKQARDFLKRWKFFEALRFCFGRDTDFLRQDQIEYLVEDQIYYLPTRRADEEGNLVELFGSRVIEISPLLEKKGNESFVSQSKINRYLSYFAEERILSGLDKGIDWGEEETFAKAKGVINYCIKEPLINAFEHADANIGLVAAQLDRKYFIISIIDNGVGIPTTIRKIYKSLEDESDEAIIRRAFSPPDKSEISEALKEVEQWKEKEDAKLIEIAHIKGVTSRPKTHGGLGLFQLKRFVIELKGFFDVRSRHGLVRFDGRQDKLSIEPKQCSDQPGTLISIFLPRKIDPTRPDRWI